MRRPAVPPPVRIRRDVNNLSPSDPIVTFYEKAIFEMQKGNKLDDPLSWRYQAAIHDYSRNLANVDSRRNDPINPDPFASSSDILPSDRDTYWRQCQHAGWFFLSWHRMYLHFFEKTIMSIVAKLPDGPTDWALPYWNYSVSASAALLPAPFRNPTIPDPVAPGKTRRNALYVAERTPNANAGLAFLDASDTNLDCLKAKPFGGSGPGGSFGGPKRRNHPPGAGGALEETPHNAVHGALGGAGGFMGGFSTAPLDPMFWLHHCNIDRLWEVWVQRQKTLGNLDRNPMKDSGWLTESFDFHDWAGNPVTINSQQVLNTRLAPLSYEYEDTSDPFKGAP